MQEIPNTVKDALLTVIDGPIKVPIIDNGYLIQMSNKYIY